jgi:hypothetical protein
VYEYQVKVRDKVYLWGSAGISVNLALPLLLSMRTDIAGDPITISTETAAGGPGTTLGTLLPGECYTVPLFGLRGVAATSTGDTNVECAILTPFLPPS